MNDDAEQPKPTVKVHGLPRTPSPDEWTTGQEIDPVPQSLLTAEQGRVLREALEAGG